MSDKITEELMSKLSVDDTNSALLLQNILKLFITRPRKMTEEEIIQYLKTNRNIGVAFNFMPKEVRDWCCNRPNYFDDFLIYKNGAWRDVYCFVNPAKDIKEMALEEIIILALPEDFKLEEKPKGEWIEFEIDENGCYRILDTDMRFHWSEWNKPLWVYEKDKNRSWYLTAFGGWQYNEQPDMWFMSPQVLKDNQEKCIKPLFPIKIRFWREMLSTKENDSNNSYDDSIDLALNG